MVEVACEVIDLLDESFLHSWFSAGEGGQSALGERYVHLGLLFLLRVFNSALMNFVASEAEKGPWTRPFLISSKPFVISRSIMRR
jgi:hypothetical protein